MKQRSTQVPEPAPRVVMSFADLAAFCGRQRPSAVKKWLQAHGILYLLDADGRPCTTVKAIDDALHRGRRTEPNWPGGLNWPSAEGPLSKHLRERRERQKRGKSDTC